MKKLLVLLTAVAMLISLTSIVSASEFSFYGNLRLKTFSWEDSKEVNAVPFQDEVQIPAAGTTEESNLTDNALAFNESDRDLDLSMSVISRFGTKVTISDELRAHLEFGLKGNSNSTTVYLRHLYGEYDFGAGKILVGQYWHPFAVNVGWSNQVGNDDDGLGTVGGFTAGRRPQVRLSFGDFAIHFMSPDHKQIAGIGDGFKQNDAALWDGTADVVVYDSNKHYDDDISWPHVAAVYNATYENFKFGITGAFQSYEVSDTRNGMYYDIVDDENKVGGKSYDVDSHGLKFGVQGDFGLFTLGATYGFGQNLDNMGIGAESKKGGATPGAFYRGIMVADDTYKYGAGAADTIGDVDTTAYTIVGAFKVNDMVTLEAGYGKISNDVDCAAQDDEARAYYLQAAIKVADGFQVTPEIGKYDYEEDGSGKDEGDATYFGAKWQINF